MELHGAQIVALVLGVAFLCQWLAWRTRIPAILFLLGSGMLAGPMLRGPELAEGLDRFANTFVPVAAALMLFEGGLNARYQDLKRVARPLWGLVTIGLTVTWALTSLGAFYLTPMSGRLAALSGAILVVTGPTVIGPLLRHMHLRGKVGPVLKFEGIVNDPIGAVLAIITFQVIQAGPLDQAIHVATIGVIRSGSVALFLGIAGAALLTLVLHRGLLPPYMRATGSAALVLVVHSLSDSVQPESGLLAVTIMGVAVASQPFVTTHDLRRSHEDLQVALVSVLFIVLVARIPLENILHLGWGALAWVAGLIVVVRPLAALASTLRTDLEWKERVLLAGIAPRGVVAAAVSSVFALRLADSDLAGHELFLPLNFSVVALTVGVYGLAAAPLARALGLTERDPQGLAILGVNPFSMELAKALARCDLRVLLLDQNHRRVMRARSEGLEAERANLPSDAEIDRLDLGDIGHFLATTSKEEVNSLVALQFQPLLEDRAYQLFDEVQGRETRIPAHLRGRALTPASRSRMVSRLARGGQIKVTNLTDDFTLSDFRESNDDAIPLFLVDPQGRLKTVYPVEPTSSQGQLVSLVGGSTEEPVEDVEDRSVDSEAPVGATEK